MLQRYLQTIICNASVKSQRQLKNTFWEHLPTNKSVGISKEQQQRINLTLKKARNHNGKKTNKKQKNKKSNLRSFSARGLGRLFVSHEIHNTEVDDKERIYMLIVVKHDSIIGQQNTCRTKWNPVMAHHFFDFLIPRPGWFSDVAKNFRTTK